MRGGAAGGDVFLGELVCMGNSYSPTPGPASSGIPAVLDHLHKTHVYGMICAYIIIPSTYTVRTSSVGIVQCVHNDRVTCRVWVSVMVRGRV